MDVIGLVEMRLDRTATDPMVSIEAYRISCNDRDSNGGGVPTKERFEQCATAKAFKFFQSSAQSYMSEMFLTVGQSRITRRSKSLVKSL